MYFSLVDKDNPGVLILSPFAGAGDTMHEALRVNPYELGNVAQVQILVDTNKMKITKINKSLIISSCNTNFYFHHF